MFYKYTGNVLKISMRKFIEFSCITVVTVEGKLWENTFELSSGGAADLGNSADHCEDYKTPQLEEVLLQ